MPKKAKKPMTKKDLKKTQKGIGRVGIGVPKRTRPARRY